MFILFLFGLEGIFFNHTLSKRRHTKGGFLKISKLGAQKIVKPVLPLYTFDKMSTQMLKINGQAPGNVPKIWTKIIGNSYNTL